jgi:hypothetical protein
MPASAYALVGFFALLSVAAGLLATRIVGPFTRWSALLPIAAAFGALYLVGHRFPIRVGPTVEVFGWQISLAFEAVVGLGAAIVAALAQRAAARLLQAKQRGARRDGLA